MRAPRRRAPGPRHQALGTRHHAADLGPVAVKWERHTEFSSYTFLRPGAPAADPFADPALAAVPTDWLAATPGRLLVAVHLAVIPTDASLERDDRQLAGLCGSNRYAGATVAGGAAAAWTDFRLHGDGFVRVLVEDRGLGERQAGRLVQRLLEVETYRTAALLAFPLALRLWPRLRALEGRLTALACRASTRCELRRVLMSRRNPTKILSPPARVTVIESSTGISSPLFFSAVISIRWLRTGPSPVRLKCSSPCEWASRYWGGMMRSAI